MLLPRETWCACVGRAGEVEVENGGLAAVRAGNIGTWGLPQPAFAAKPVQGTYNIVVTVASAPGCFLHGILLRHDT